MIGVRTEQRRRFTKDEKTSILRRSNCRCARCGVELSTSTMTVEHIIPISHGGTNSQRNLLALCEECNRVKADKVYYPGDYYDYMYPKYMSNSDIHNLAVEWFSSYKDEFDFESYPLISPTITMTVDTTGITALTKNFSNSMQLDISHMDKNSKDKYREYCKKYPYGETCYSIVHRTSGRLLAIFSAKYRINYPVVPDQVNLDAIVINVLYTSMQDKNCASVFNTLAGVLASRFVEIGKSLDIVQVYVNKSVVLKSGRASMPVLLGRKCMYGQLLYSDDNNSDVYSIVYYVSNLSVAKLVK